MPPYTVSGLGILMAAVLAGFFLFVLGKAAGAGLAVLFAILILAAIDFLRMRNWPVIAGQVIGLLGVTGFYYILILMGVVR
jgi:hypothetical protein